MSEFDTLAIRRNEASLLGRNDTPDPTIHCTRPERSPKHRRRTQPRSSSRLLLRTERSPSTHGPGGNGRDIQEMTSLGYWDFLRLGGALRHVRLWTVAGANGTHGLKLHSLLQPSPCTSLSTSHSSIGTSCVAKWFTQER
jgi:hypothetical protein